MGKTLEEIEEYLRDEAEWYNTSPHQHNMAWAEHLADLVAHVAKLQERIDVQVGTAFIMDESFGDGPTLGPNKLKARREAAQELVLMADRAIGALKRHKEDVRASDLARAVNVFQAVFQEFARKYDGQSV